MYMYDHMKSLIRGIPLLLAVFVSRERMPARQEMWMNATHYNG